MAGTEDFVELESVFSSVARDLFAPATVEGTLQQIADLARRTVDGCEAAGILLVSEKGEVCTVAASGALVREVDQLQIDASEGPCLDAATQGTTIYASDSYRQLLASITERAADLGPTPAATRSSR